MVQPSALKVDNQPVIVLAKNPVLHDRSKHIDVKFHFLRDCVDGGQLVIEFAKPGSNSLTSSPIHSGSFGFRN
jgi:hypothetical protein